MIPENNQENMTEKRAESNTGSITENNRDTLSRRQSGPVRTHRSGFRSMLVSLIVTVGMMALLAAATLAWFSDTAVTGGSSVVTGYMGAELLADEETIKSYIRKEKGMDDSDDVNAGMISDYVSDKGLDIYSRQVQGQEAQTYYRITGKKLNVITLDNVEPGQAYPVHFYVANTGDLAFTYSAGFTVEESLTGLQRFERETAEGVFNNGYSDYHDNPEWKLINMVLTSVQSETDPATGEPVIDPATGRPVDKGGHLEDVLEVYLGSTRDDIKPENYVGTLADIIGKATVSETGGQAAPRNELFTGYLLPRAAVEDENGVIVPRNVEIYDAEMLIRTMENTTELGDLNMIVFAPYTMGDAYQYASISISLGAYTTQVEYEKDGTGGMIYDRGAYTDEPEASAGDKPETLYISRTYNGFEQNNGYTPSEHTVVSGDPKGTYAGTYVAVYTPAKGYTWSDGTTDAVTVTLTIDKAAGSVDSPVPRVLVYDGTQQTLADAGYSSTGTVLYRLGEGGSYGPGVPEARDAGSYRIYYKVSGDSNHEEVGESYIDVNIEQRTAALSWGELIWSYDGTAHSTTCTVSNLCEGDTCDVILEGNSITEIGTVTVTATDLTNDNYKLPTEISELTRTLTVKNASAGDRPDTEVNTVYDGSEQSNGYTPSEHVTVTGDTKGTDAGTYTAVYTPKDGYVWSDGSSDPVTVTLTIAKAPGIVTAPAAKTLVYNGEEQTLAEAGSSGTGTVKYRLETEESYGPGVPAAKNAGTYRVYYMVSGDANHEDVAETFIEVTIERREAELSWGEITWTYDGNAHHTTCTVTNLCEGDSCEVAISGNGITDAGTKDVRAMALTNDNYRLPSEASELTRTLTVNKAPGVLTDPQITAYTYNGTEQTLIENEATSDTGTVMYKLEEGGAYGTGIPKARNAGTYKIYYKSEGDANHEDVEERYVEVEILQREAELSWDGLIWTYDGAAHSATCTVGNLCAGDDCTVTFTGNSITNVGTATVTVTGFTGADSGNYKLPSDESMLTRTITVNKAPGQVTAPTAKTLAYTGEEQVLINEGSSSTGTVQYRLEEGSYGTELPKAANAGAYKVYYRVIGDENHEDVEEAYISVTIARAKVADPVNGVPRAYTGSSMSHNVTPPEHTHIVEDDSDMEATESGVYRVKLAIDDTSNYEWQDGTVTDRTAIWIIAVYSEITSSDGTVLDEVLADKSKALEALDNEKIFTVPLKLNEKISGITGGTTYNWPVQIYDVTADGTVTLGPALGQNSVLHNNIAPAYRQWNMAASNNYATSHIRATLIGTDMMTAPNTVDEGVAGTDNLTSSNCLLSCFPDSLTGKDKGADYRYGIVAKTMQVPTSWDWRRITSRTGVSDRLWLFSMNELCGTNVPEGYNDTESGGQMGLLIKRGVDGHWNVNSLSCYSESGDNYRTFRWLRSIYHNDYPRFGHPVAMIGYQGALGSCDSENSNGQNGLAPGFCLKTLDAASGGVGDKPDVTSVRVVYNGSEQTNGYTKPKHVSVTGETKGTDAGTYTATYTPDDGCMWSDGSDDAVTVTLIIDKAPGSLTAPSAKPLTYTGEEQTLINEGSSSTGDIQYRLEGESYGTELPRAADAGTYKVYYRVIGDANHEDVAEAYISVTIAKVKVMIPANGADRSYTGSSMSHNITVPAHTHIIEAVSDMEAAERGTYHVVIALDDASGYEWSDGTITAKTAEWRIVVYYGIESPDGTILDEVLENVTAAIEAMNDRMVFTVPLKLNETISGKTGGAEYDWPVQIYNVASDGTVTFGPALGEKSILYNNIADSYLQWNQNGSTESGSCEQANYATSRMRATLVGSDDWTPSSYADAGTCLTGSNCLLSCFPDSLKDTPNGSDYGIVAKKMKIPVGWSKSSPNYTIDGRTEISDRLWLFSANEIYGAAVDAKYNDADSGAWMQLLKESGVSSGWTNELSSSSSTFWLRSPCRSQFYLAVRILGKTGGISSNGVESAYEGLAPGFCMKVFNVETVYPDIISDDGTVLDEVLENKESAKEAMEEHTVFKVPLDLNETISGVAGGTTYKWRVQIYDVDEATGTVTFGPALAEYTGYGEPGSILYNKIAPVYRQWNPNYAGASGTNPASNYATSHIRATLIGTDKMTAPNAVNTTWAGSVNLTSSNCLLSCFPDSLKDNPNGSEYGIVAKTMKVPTELTLEFPDYEIKNRTEISDRLWLFSANELYGMTGYSYHDDVYSGEQLQLFDSSHLNVSFSSHGKLICNIENGEPQNRWLRAPNSNLQYRVHVVYSDGRLADYPVDHSGSGSGYDGLAPGFCLRLLNE